MPQAQQEITTPTKRHNNNSAATKPTHEQHLKSSIGKLSGLQCDSFTLIDANSTTTAALARHSNASAQQLQRPLGGHQEQDNGTVKGRRESSPAAGDHFDGQRLRLLKVFSADTSKAPGKQQVAHEPNNNTIFQRHQPQLRSSPIGSAAIARMDSSNRQQRNSPGSGGPNGTPPAVIDQTSANNGTNAATSLSSTTTTTTTSASSYRQSVLTTSNHTEPLTLMKSPGAQQQQQPTPSYSSIFNQPTKQSPASDTSVQAFYSNHYNRSTTPPDQSKQPTVATILTKTGQRVPLKKQLAADLSESSAFLLSKKSTKREPLNPASSNNRLHPSRTREEQGDYVVSRFDGDEDDDDDDEQGLDDDAETEDEEASTSNSDERSANGNFSQGEESEDLENDEMMIDERLPFSRDGKLLLSNKTRRLAEQENLKNSRNSNNKRIMTAANESANINNKYPGTAHHLHNNIRQHQQQMVVAARQEKKLGGSSIKSGSKSSIVNGKKHQSDGNNQTKISMQEIGRPPSFNTCQQTKQSTNNNSSAASRECRKLDLLDQVAHLNCNCNNCSKKRKLAAQYSNGSIAYINGSAANLEAGAPYPWVRKYPKTNIMHLILKSIILILCTLLLIVVTFSMIMLSIHMPHAFDKVLNVSRSFNVTIAG